MNCHCVRSFAIAVCRHRGLTLEVQIPMDQRENRVTFCDLDDAIPIAHAPRESDACAVRAGVTAVVAQHSTSAASMDKSEWSVSALRATGSSQ